MVQCYWPVPLWYLILAAVLVATMLVHAAVGIARVLIDPDRYAWRMPPPSPMLLDYYRARGRPGAYYDRAGRFIGVVP